MRLQKEKSIAMQDTGKASIPIFAATADAFQEDMEKIQESRHERPYSKTHQYKHGSKAIDQSTKGR